MKKLILLVGEQNTGKTITLKMLVAMLLPYSKICKSPRTQRTVDSLWKEIDTEMNSQKTNNRNFRIVFDLFGKRIGIHTIGDSISEVKATIEFFKNNPCDIIIAPCHPDISHIQSFYNAYGNDIHTIPKAKSKTQQEQYFDNMSMANELFQLITKMIK